jgi:hypothetical protein
VLCGARGSTREDVFARWISRLLVELGGAPFSSVNTHGRSKSGTQNIGVYSWAVCRECNNEWMSGIEQLAKPLLVPAIRGETVSWDIDEQTAIAVWCFKTALMIDRSNAAAEKVPAEHFDCFRHSRLPPPTTQIRVACYTPRAGELIHGVTLGVGTGAQWVQGSYRISFSVGGFVAIVHGRGGLDEGGIEVDVASVTSSGLWVPGASTFPKLWPTRSDVFAWPPPHGMSLSSANLLQLNDVPRSLVGSMPSSR